MQPNKDFIIANHYRHLDKTPKGWRLIYIIRKMEEYTNNQVRCKVRTHLAFMIINKYANYNNKTL